MSVIPSCSSRRSAGRRSRLLHGRPNSMAVRMDAGLIGLSGTAAARGRRLRVPYSAAVAGSRRGWPPRSRHCPRISEHPVQVGEVAALSGNAITVLTTACILAESRSAAGTRGGFCLLGLRLVTVVSNAAAGSSGWSRCNFSFSSGYSTAQQAGGQRAAVARIAQQSTESPAPRRSSSAHSRSRTADATVAPAPRLQVLLDSDELVAGRDRGYRVRSQASLACSVIRPIDAEV